MTAGFELVLEYSNPAIIVDEIKIQMLKPTPFVTFSPMLHLPDVLDITCNEAVATTTYLQSANIKALHTLALPATVEFTLDYFTPAVGQDSDEDADAPPLRQPPNTRDSDEDQDKHLFQKRNYYGLPYLPPSRKYYVLPLTVPCFLPKRVLFRHFVCPKMVSTSPTNIPQPPMSSSTSITFVSASRIYRGAPSGCDRVRPAASLELIASLVEVSTPSACVPARRIRGDFAELGMKERRGPPYVLVTRFGV
ncbi:hypothetical protein F5887DRAFT_916862 [Amanita rubescens]|nr:hypothetical protein F5887DRAFT_916862 [Amanita rubescens]